MADIYKQGLHRNQQLLLHPSNDGQKAYHPKLFRHDKKVW